MNNKMEFEKIIPPETLEDATLEQVSAGAQIGDYKIGDMVRFSITVPRILNPMLPRNVELVGEIYGTKNGKYKIFSDGDFYEVWPGRIRGKV